MQVHRAGLPAAVQREERVGGSGPEPRLAFRDVGQSGARGEDAEYQPSRPIHQRHPCLRRLAAAKTDLHQPPEPALAAQER